MGRSSVGPAFLASKPPAGWGIGIFSDDQWRVESIDIYVQKATEKPPPLSNGKVVGRPTVLANAQRFLQDKTVGSCAGKNFREVVAIIPRKH